MNIITRIIFATLLICYGISAHAQMSEEAKIEHLIASIEKMPEGTKFVRNGVEYGSEKAAQHLRMKYEKGKKYAATAELFIENIASKSYMTGEKYLIKFADGTTMTARDFFLAELEKIKN